jgi:midasin (ATPase involved in ribosome maturation)
MDEISNDLCEGHKDRLQNDSDLQASIKERSQLPVFAMRNTIMNAINDHSVIIIRGNTGCGKTTQVRLNIYLSRALVSVLNLTCLKTKLYLNFRFASLFWTTTYSQDKVLTAI